jgi:signal transduction histidine kinase
VDELRKELEQAKQLGEAYARELAEVFSTGAGASSPSKANVEVADDSTGSERFDLLRGVGAALVRHLRPLLDGMEVDLEKVRGKLGDGASAVQGLQQRYAAMRETLGELNRVANADYRDTPETMLPGTVVTEVVASAERRSSRHGVKLSVLNADSSPTPIRRSILTLLVRSLLDHAIAATPRDGVVRVTVGPAPDGGITVVVRDGGPGVPPRAHTDLLRHRLDPTSMGRPAGVTLLVADTAAAILGARLSLGEGAGGGLEVRLVLPAGGV